jgi:hypothetical protein
MFNPYHHILMFVLYQNYVYIRTYISCVFLVVFIHQRLLRSETFHALHRLPTKLTDKPQLFSRFTWPLPNLTVRHSCIRQNYSWNASYRINYPTPTDSKCKCRERHEILGVQESETRSANAVNDTRYWVFRNLRLEVHMPWTTRDTGCSGIWDVALWTYFY